MTSVQKLYRVREAADILAVSVATLRKYILRRTIAVVRVGRAVRVPESELLRLQREGLTPRREAALIGSGAPARELASGATPPTSEGVRS